MSELKLAVNMRILREVYGYSQDDVSSLLHIARQTCSNYERGRRIPDVLTIVKIAALYGITVDQLLFGDFTGVHDTEDIIRDHSAVTPEESLIRLNGSEAHMLMDYKSLPKETQKEIREFVSFKKQLLLTEPSGDR